MKLKQFLDQKGMTTQQFKEKMNFYRYTLKLDRYDTIDMFRRCIKILDIDVKDPKQSKDKLVFIKETFRYTEFDLAQAIFNNPRILLLNKMQILDQLALYELKFKRPYEEIIAVISENPELLCYDLKSDKPASVNGKIDFYVKELGVSEEDVKEMLIENPRFLKMETINNLKKEISKKMFYLRQITDNQSVVKNPNLLYLVAERLKMRYLILAEAMPDEEIFKSRALRRKETVLWARRQYLKEEKCNLKGIGFGKSRFEKTYKVNVNTLTEKYPLNEDSIKEIEDNYLTRTGKALKLDNAEKEMVLKCRMEKEEEME